MPRRLLLDRKYLVQMLLAADFYESVPAFRHLQAVAAATWAAAAAGACGGCDGWRSMQGVCDAMFLTLKDLQSRQDPSIEQIRAWLSARKGYPVGRCAVYYRSSDAQGRRQIRRLEF